MSVLIAYGTVEGQTAKIARFVQEVVRGTGEEAELFDTSDRHHGVDFAPYDKVILAASVHERRHPKEFEVFVTGHHAALAARRTLMLSISLSAAFPEGVEEAQDYVDEMKMRTGLVPDAEVLVAGAVRARRYGYYETQVLRHVVLRDREFDGDAVEHEFTDWQALAERVYGFLDPAPQTMRRAL